MVSNLLIIAGTGTKSGKTSMACRILEQFKNLNVTAIKISPHFHETSPGLIPKFEGKGYVIYEETNSETVKDTSRMLRAGAGKVYLILVWDNDLEDVFNRILKEIPEGTPVVCESPALRNYFEPGAFIIMTSNTENYRMDLKYLQEYHHTKFRLEDLEKTSSLPIHFEEGKWYLGI